jgi:hypothetical protein
VPTSSTIDVARVHGVRCAELARYGEPRVRDRRPHIARRHVDAQHLDHAELDDPDAEHDDVLARNNLRKAHHLRVGQRLSGGRRFERDVRRHIAPAATD